MKSSATEFSHIVDAVTGLALAHPQVEFTLKHNGRIYFHLIATPNLGERIAAVLGEDYAEKLIQVDVADSHLKLTGFVARPEMNSARPDRQYLYVNGRRIQTSLLSSAVKKAYGTTLMPRSYPVFVLFLALPQEMVDVNVHPRKAEVAFVNAGAIYNFILQAVSTKLGKVDLTYGRNETWDKRTDWGIVERGSGIGETWGVSWRSRRDTWGGGEKGEVQFDWTTLDTSLSHQSQEILQVHKTYLIKQSMQGVEIIDQHAAHERVLYEKFLRRFEESSVESQTQRLLVPVDLSLSSSDREVLVNHIKLLEKLGFIFEGNKVVGVPLEIQQKDIKALLHEFLSDLRGGELRSVDDASLRALTYLSCRSAVKAGDFLSSLERQKLLSDLENCQLPYTCPHGRPVTIDLSLRELEKMFKRVL